MSCPTAYCSCDRPGVESALELYQNLVTACLKAYDVEDGGPSDAGVASTTCSPSTLQETLTPPDLQAAFDFNSPQRAGNYFPHASPPPPLSNDIPVPRSVDSAYISPPASNHSLSDSGMNNDCQLSTSAEPPNLEYDAAQQRAFNPDSFFHSFPQNFDYSQALPPADYTYMQNLGQVGDQYSQYLHGPYVPQTSYPSLTEEQWPELLEDLQNRPTDWG